MQLVIDINNKRGIIGSLGILSASLPVLTISSTAAEKESPPKRLRLAEGWQLYTATDGQSADLPPFLN